MFVHILKINFENVSDIFFQFGNYQSLSESDISFAATIFGYFDFPGITNLSDGVR
jgi:hypothetical protein